MLATLLQYSYEDTASLGISSAALAAIFGVALFVWLFGLACTWRIFTKAGEPGWYSIIPILNVYTLCKIAGRPGIWFLLLLIPCVGTILGVILVFDLASEFGKGAAFGLGLLFLPFIFYPILAFGPAEYYGTSRLLDSRYPGRGGMAPAGFTASGSTYGQPMPRNPMSPFDQATSHSQTSAPSLPSLPSVTSPGTPPSQLPVAGTPASNTPVQPPPAPQQSGPQAGWYPDPTGGTGFRWWDGAMWTDHRSDG